MYSSRPTAVSGAEAGPSRPRPQPVNAAQPCDLTLKPKKRRRLQFSSELRNNTIQRYNPDGTETVEYLHQQSTQRLKRKWESIFERFKDAHLQEQDEIYLGNRANGEPIVVVKDRGSLRSLRQSMEFGVFIKDEELQGWKDRPEAREMQEHEDEYGVDFDPSHAPMHRAPLAGASSSESDDEEDDDPAANDPDLREFLQAEARSKAMLSRSGQADQEPEEDDEVIDFAHPMWNAFEPGIAQIAQEPPLKPDRPAGFTSNPSVALPRSTSDAPDLVVSSSEDEDDADIVTVRSDSDEELIDSIRTKRQNIEELLQCTTPFETLPYNDIFGLADLLRLTDNTSRLYVDLVSDDEDQIVGAEQAAGVIEITSSFIKSSCQESVARRPGDSDVIDISSSLPGSSIGQPNAKKFGDEDVIEITSSLPVTSPLPASSLIAGAPSSPLSELPSSRASSVVPVAPRSVRGVSPMEPSSPTAEITLVHRAQEHTPAMALPSSFPSVQSTQSSQPVSAAAEASTTPPRLPPNPANPSPPITSTMVQKTPRKHIQPSPPLPSTTSKRSGFSSVTPAAFPVSPFKLPTSASEPHLPSSSHHDRHSSSHVKPSHPPGSADRDRHDHRRRKSQHRRSSQKAFEELDHDDHDGETKGRRSKCGGPGRCKKTFCLDCASLARG